MLRENTHYVFFFGENIRWELVIRDLRCYQHSRNSGSGSEEGEIF